MSCILHGNHKITDGEVIVVRMTERRDCSVAHKSELIEILEFTHFFEHFTFEKTDWSERGKHMKKYIRVVVAVELVTVGAKIEPTS